MRNIRVSEIMGGWKREVERVEERGRKGGRERKNGFGGEVEERG